MKLLIDGDMLVHRSTVAVEKDVRFDDEFHILFSDEKSAWTVLEDTLYDLKEIACTSDIVMAFSDPKRNFRKDIVGDDYKSNRVGVRKPLCYWDIRKRCEAEFESSSIPTLEADDVMGILMTQHPGEFILWSLDKDLKQIPGQHIRDDEVLEITEEEGDRFFLYQCLAGDKTDGYSGVPGCGDVKARKLLDKECSWDTVLAAYEKAGLTIHDALYNAQMARILRVTDYDFDKRRPILWTP